jgi:hypothetical protein
MALRGGLGVEVVEEMRVEKGGWWSWVVEGRLKGK